MSRRCFRSPWHLLAAIMVLTAFVSGRCPADEPAPKPLRLAPLGRPTAGKAEAARKLSELFFFEGRLYIGHGDYGVNTGPTDVISYDPEANTFQTEFTADDEAIETYRQIGGKLVIPGPDATEAWDLGNLYIREGGDWEKRRTVPRGVHVLDVVAFRDRWYAAAGIVVDLAKDQNFACGAVFSSGDEGKAWQFEYTTASSGAIVTRIGSLAPYKDKLFAFPYSYTTVSKEELPPALAASLKNPLSENGKEFYLLLLPSPPGGPDALAFDGRRWESADAVGLADSCSIKSFVFRDQLVMTVVVGKFVPSSRHYDARKDGLPAGVSTQLWTSDGKQSRAVPLAFDVVKDVLAREEALSLLVLKGGRFFIARTKDLADWEWFALPETDAEPLSIEQAGADYYVGRADGVLLKTSAAE